MEHPKFVGSEQQHLDSETQTRASFRNEPVCDVAVAEAPPISPPKVAVHDSTTYNGAVVYQGRPRHCAQVESHRECFRRKFKDVVNVHEQCTYHEVLQSLVQNNPQMGLLIEEESCGSNEQARYQRAN